MSSNQESNLRSDLPPELKGHLNVIEAALGNFWLKNRHHNHFTLHGVDQSKQVERILSQIIEKKPTDFLNEHEKFILVACAYLYEIGMQSRYLKPVPGFDMPPNGSLSFADRQIIRKNRHTLTANLIRDGKDPDISLGLASVGPVYVKAITTVCGSCSNEKVSAISEIEYIDRTQVRLRLLTALLQLADQLYIDKERIHPAIHAEQIEGNPATPELARWRAFEYVQLKPIKDGKICFRYVLPEDQKDLLGHIRGLIEPEFYLERNAAMKILGPEFDISVWPPLPSVEDAPPAGEFLSMNRIISHYVNFIRRIEPIPPRKDPNNQEALLIVDVINLMRQLMREGHACNLNFLTDLIVKLRSEVSRTSRVNTFWAIAPWNRLDMKEIENVIQGMGFVPISLEDGEGASKKTRDVVNDQLNHGYLQHRVIFVAPSKELAPFIGEIGQTYLIETWINRVEEPQIYVDNAFSQKTEYLTELLELNTTDKPLKSLTNEEYFTVQEILAFALHFEMRLQETSTLGLSKILESLDPLCESETSLWWLIILIDNKVVNYRDQTYSLNQENDLVARVLKKFNLIERCFKSLGQDEDGIREDLLLKNLRADSDLFKNDTSTRSLLNLLKTEEILRRKSIDERQETPPYWQINLEHIVFKNVSAYLPRFVIALDQVMLRIRKPKYPHDTLTKDLAIYVGDDLVEKIYSKATSGNWVRIQEAGDRFVLIEEENPEVVKTFRNRAILLSFFLKGNQMNTAFLLYDLWERLRLQTMSFNLPSEEFSEWVKIFNIDNMLLGEETTDGRKVKLNLESKILQDLYAKLYLPGLVRTMRRMQAISPDKKKNKDEVASKLVEWSSSCNQLVATWTIGYAQRIRLVLVDQEMIWLDRGHGYVNMLDRKETIKERKLLELVIRSSRNPDGWVPKAVVISEMDKALMFGHSRQEQEYWLEQAIHRQKLVQDRRPDRDGHLQICIRAVSK